MKKLLLLLCLWTAQAQAGIIPLSDFCKGDGTDESAAFQQAVNVANGATIYLSQPKTYYVRNITVNGYDNFEIAGVPGAHIAYFRSSVESNGWLMQFNNCTRLTLDGLQLDGSKPQMYGSVVQLIGCTDVLINGLKIRDAMGEGIALKNTKYAVIRECTITNTDVGVLMVEGNERVEICHNYIEDGTSDGIAVGWSENPYPTYDRGCLIHDNVIRNKPGNGVLTKWCKSVTIAQNDLWNNHIGVTAEDVIGGSRAIVVDNNRIYNSTEYGIAGSFTNSRITNNLIDSSNVYGMRIGSFGRKQTTNNTIVSGNIIGNTQTAIMLTDVVECSLNGNTVYDDRVKPCTYAGLILNQGRDNKVTGNTLAVGVFQILIQKDNQSGRSADRTILYNNSAKVTDQAGTTIVLDNTVADLVKRIALLELTKPLTLPGARGRR